MEKDNYSHMRIMNDFMRTPEFVKFQNRRISTNFYFLLAGIVRDLDGCSDLSSGMNYIYNQHYLHGRLVARYKQDAIAEYLETNQGRVSKNMTELTQRNFIKKIYRKMSVGRILYYQLGTWEGTLGDEKTYKEIIWADEIFKGFARVAKQKRGEKNPHKVTGSLVEYSKMLDPTHPDFCRLNREWNE